MHGHMVLGKFGFHQPQEGGYSVKRDSLASGKRKWLGATLGGVPARRFIPANTMEC